MSDIIHPYSDRRALPISFYPLLSAEDDVDSSGIQQFVQSLRQTPPPDPHTLLYIHVPFCESICRFCGFYRRLPSDFLPMSRTNVLDQFTDCLIHEMQAWRQVVDPSVFNINSVYIGGGTPSLLSCSNIDAIIGSLREHFLLKPDCEITFEGEVRSIGDAEKLKRLRDLGVTRVSFGVQSFHETVRKLNGLQPTVKQIRECAELVRNTGFQVNLDLMYGLPAQDFEIFMNDLSIAVNEIGVSHIDLYDTILYPNNDLFVRRDVYNELMPSESDAVMMMRRAVEYLRSEGFIQLTADDFIRPGSEYKMKDLIYGSNSGHSQVLAMGPTAVGYLGHTSYRNEIIENYVQSDWKIPSIQRLRTCDDYEKSNRALIFYPKRLFLNQPDLCYAVTSEARAILDQHIHNLLAFLRQDNVIELTETGKLWVDSMSSEFLSSAEKRRIFKLVQ